MNIKFFHRDLPVVGDASVVKFDNGDYKFWEVVNAQNERCLVFREMLGVITLQERLDYFLRCESGSTPAGYRMIWAHHVIPARKEAVKLWEKHHQEQMEGYIG